MIWNALYIAILQKLLNGNFYLHPTVYSSKLQFLELIRQSKKNELFKNSLRII